MDRIHIAAHRLGSVRLVIERIARRRDCTLELHVILQIALQKRKLYRRLALFPVKVGSMLVEVEVVVSSTAEEDGTIDADSSAESVLVMEDVGRVEVVEVVALDAESETVMVDCVAVLVDESVKLDSQALGSRPPIS
jgi:hypothetical protein